MGMMKTIAILQDNCMAPVGYRKYGVCTSGKNKVALVYVEDRDKANHLADSLNRIRRRIIGDRPAPFRSCVGPDHKIAGRLAPPLIS